MPSRSHRLVSLAMILFYATSQVTPLVAATCEPRLGVLGRVLSFTKSTAAAAWSRWRLPEIKRYDPIKVELARAYYADHLQQFGHLKNAKVPETFEEKIGFISAASFYALRKYGYEPLYFQPVMNEAGWFGLPTGWQKDVALQMRRLNTQKGVSSVRIKGLIPRSYRTVHADVYHGYELLNRTPGLPYRVRNYFESMGHKVRPGESFKQKVVRRKLESMMVAQVVSESLAGWGLLKDPSRLERWMENNGLLVEIFKSIFFNVDILSIGWPLFLPFFSWKKIEASPAELDILINQKPGWQKIHDRLTQAIEKDHTRSYPYRVIRRSLNSVTLVVMSLLAFHHLHRDLAAEELHKGAELRQKIQTYVQEVQEEASPPQIFLNAENAYASDREAFLKEWAAHQDYAEELREALFHFTNFSKDIELAKSRNMGPRIFVGATIGGLFVLFLVRKSVFKQSHRHLIREGLRVAVLTGFLSEGHAFLEAKDVNDLVANISEAQVEVQRQLDSTEAYLTQLLNMVPAEERNSLNQIPSIP